MALRLPDGERVVSARAKEVDVVRRARARAESMRLFYVATTRARDRLILSGEGGKDSWRAHVDALLAEDLSAIALVTGVAPAPPAPRPVEAPVAPPDAGVDGAVLALLDAPRTAAETVVIGVTELADLDRCPERYRLKHEVGLDEPARPGVGSSATKELGSLAHLLLERVDLAAWRARGAALLDDILAAEGIERTDDVVEIRRGIAAFLGGAFGASLASRPVLREVPFAYAPGAAGGGLPAGRRARTDGSGDRRRESSSRSSTTSSARSDRSRAIGSSSPPTQRPPAPSGSGRCASVSFTYARRTPSRRSSNQRTSRPGRSPASDSSSRRDGGPGTFTRRTVDRCEAMGCGYVNRCHGDSGSDRGPRPEARGPLTAD